MIRVFLDASVIFAAAYSQTGASRELLRRALKEQVRLVVSQDVLTEAKRNLADKAPDAAALLDVLTATLDPEMAPPAPAELIRQVAEYVVDKDVLVVAGALAAQVNTLVTFDRKHLIDPPEVAGRSGLRIVLPEVVVEELRQAYPDE